MPSRQSSSSWLNCGQSLVYTGERSFQISCIHCGSFAFCSASGVARAVSMSCRAPAYIRGNSVCLYFGFFLWPNHIVAYCKRLCTVRPESCERRPWRFAVDMYRVRTLRFVTWSPSGHLASASICDCCFLVSSNQTTTHFPDATKVQARVCSSTSQAIQSTVQATLQTTTPSTLGAAIATIG